MRILVTNDDGINADGLYALVTALRRRHVVTVCAPEAEQSAIGHAITLSKPLRVKEVRKNGARYGFAVNGTPADCVKIAVRALMDTPPDMVISGINHGPNLGSDIMYSGTVSAATEGTILGIPSLAISLATYTRFDFRPAATTVQQLIRLFPVKSFPDGVLLNVNMPAVALRDIRGMIITQQGRSLYKERFVRRIDPRGRVYYWLTGKAHWLRKPYNSDIKAIEDNYVSITPLQLDLTAYNAMEKFASFLGVKSV